MLPVLWTPGVYTLTSVLKTRRAGFQTCETLVKVMRQTNDLTHPGLNTTVHSVSAGLNTGLLRVSEHSYTDAATVPSVERRQWKERPVAPDSSIV